MTTAEAREQLHRHIDELSPRLLEIVIRSCHVLLLRCGLVPAVDIQPPGATPPK